MNGLGSKTSADISGGEWVAFGFNPCCDGLGSKTSQTECGRENCSNVSILVVMDWVQRQGPCDDRAEIDTKFQSLL